MNTTVSSAAIRRRRRKHSPEFKAQLIAACEQPGMSSAAVAMANGVNANLLRRWVVEAEQRAAPSLATLPSSVPTPSAASEFVPLQLPAPKPQPEIRIDLQRSGVSVSVAWPVNAAAECATWLREVLR